MEAHLPLSPFSRKISVYNHLKHLLLLLLFILIGLISIAQNFIKQWDKSFGGIHGDQLYAIINTPDSGYLLGGSSISPVSGDKTSETIPGDFGYVFADFWVIKVDAKGNKIWDKTYGGKTQDILRSIVASPDGGYLLGGTSEDIKILNQGGASSTKGGDYRVIKIDATGNQLWDRKFGSDTADVLQALVASTNGGYLLGGYSDGGISGDKTSVKRGDFCYWIVKIDANGNKKWDKTFGGDTSFCGPLSSCVNVGNRLTSLIGTSDGGFLVGGSSNGYRDAIGGKSEDAIGE